MEGRRVFGLVLAGGEGKRLMPLLKESGIELEGPPELIEVHNIEKR